MMDSLQVRVMGCQPEHILLENAITAREILEDLDVEDVKNASEIALPFYGWVRLIIEENFSFQNMLFMRKDNTLVTERKKSNNKHMYKLQASRLI